MTNLRRTGGKLNVAERGQGNDPAIGRHDRISADILRALADGVRRVSLQRKVQPLGAYGDFVDPHPVVISVERQREAPRGHAGVRQQHPIGQHA